MKFTKKNAYGSEELFHMAVDRDEAETEFTVVPHGYVAGEFGHYMGRIARKADVRAGWLVQASDRYRHRLSFHLHPDDFYPAIIPPANVDQRTFQQMASALHLSSYCNEKDGKFTALISILDRRIRVTALGYQNDGVIVQVDNDPEVLKVVAECGFHAVTLDGQNHFIIKASEPKYDNSKVSIDGNNPLDFAKLGFSTSRPSFILREDGGLRIVTNTVTIIDENKATAFDPRLRCLSTGSTVFYESYSVEDRYGWGTTLRFDPLKVGNKLPAREYHLHPRDGVMMVGVDHPMLCDIAFSPRHGEALKLHFRVKDRNERGTRFTEPPHPDNVARALADSEIEATPGNRASFVSLVMKDSYFILVRAHESGIVVRRAEAMRSSPDRKLLNLALPPKATLVTMSEGELIVVRHLRPIGLPYYIRSEVDDAEAQADLFRRAKAMQAQIRPNRDHIASMKRDQVELAEEIQFKVLDGALVPTEDRTEGPGTVRCPLTWIYYKAAVPAAN